MKIDDRRQFNSDGTPRDTGESKAPARSEPSEAALRIGNRIGIAIVTLLIVGFVGNAIFNSDEKPGGAAEPTAPRALDQLRAHAACRIAVEESLKAPRSADFPVESYRQAVEDLGGGRFRHRSYVDSENAFGAMLRTRFVCEVEDDGRGGARLVRLDFGE